MAGKAITIQDIARQAGTSPTTVSFVLNDRWKEMRISEELCQKVLQTARDMNFRPSLVARSLATKKTFQLGAVIPYIAEAYGPDVTAGIESEARQHGYHISVAAHRNDTGLLTDSIEKALDSSFDGLIIVPTLPFHDKKAYRELLDSGKPAVFVERDPGEEDISFVSSDAARSVSMGVRHLASLGHRRIALYQLPVDDPELNRRRIGYQVAHDELSLPYDPSLLLCAASHGSDARDPHEILDNLKRLMRRSSRPTAIIGISALRCVAIYEGLTDLGYRVPEDVSLIAITGQKFGSFHRARITSVRFSYEEIGSLACRIVINAIENPGSHPQRAYVPAHVVEGDTTCPPGTQ